MQSGMAVQNSSSGVLWLGDGDGSTPSRRRKTITNTVIRVTISTKKKIDTPSRM